MNAHEETKSSFGNNGHDGVAPLSGSARHEVPRRRGLKVIVLGIMGRAPFAGVAWQVMHYLEGFRREGCDVYYVEDTGEWPFDPEKNSVASDCSYAVNFIAGVMAWCGFSYRWAYRSGASGGVFGLSDAAFHDLLNEADVLVNLTGATVLGEEHRRVPVRIYVETDPVRPEIEVALGNQSTIDLLGAHTHHFTYGENIGSEGCDIPLERFYYLPTREPIVLDWWKPNENGSGDAARDAHFTTISSWRLEGRDIEWKGKIHRWSKHLEFLKFVDLPQQAHRQFELALAPGDLKAERFQMAVELLTGHGWHVVDALALSREILSYRSYITGSRGEFTVAKGQYVHFRSGWFSDRSACYLAAGRPVITQDTGFGDVLPTGRGLFAFRTRDDILEALDQIESDYELHSKAGREIAAEYFAAEKVVHTMMEGAGLA